jgi:hypothetical protein
MFTPSKGRKGNKDPQALRSHEFYQRELAAAAEEDKSLEQQDEDFLTICKASLVNAGEEIKRNTKKMTKLLAAQEQLQEDAELAGRQPNTKKAKELKEKIAALKIRSNEALTAGMDARTRLFKLEEMRNSTIQKPARLPEAAMMPKKLSVSLSMSEREINNFLAECEVAFNNARFPMKERTATGFAHRWSSMLGQLMVAREENKVFIASLSKIPWERAKKALIIRFATKSDKFHACRPFLSMKQKQGEDVTSYAERFESLLKDTLGEGVVDANAAGVEGHFLYQYIFQMGLLEPLKKALLADPKYLGCQSEPSQVLEILQQKERALATAALLTQHIAVLSARNGGSGGGGGGNKRDSSMNSSRGANGHGQQPRKKVNGGSNSSSSQQTCSRCQRSGADGHSAATCKAMFDGAGFRIAGVPPGHAHNASWKDMYKGCAKCGSKDHVPRACSSRRSKFVGQARRAPAVRAFGLQRRQWEASGSAAAASVLGKRARADDESDQDYDRDDNSEQRDMEGEAAEAGRAHEEEFGCGLCGEDHETKACPAHLAA